MPRWGRFCFVGLLVAGLEEFITQGVLKGDLGGWVVPTLLAFTPFLLGAMASDRLLRRRFGEAPAALAGYLGAGTVGLLFEWFAMGLSPWRDPNLLQVPFQLGMFSFWCTVAFAPRICLDGRERLAGIRRAFVWALILGFVLIYGVAFAVPKDVRFAAVLTVVLLTFLVLNAFQFTYLRALRRMESGDGPPKTLRLGP
jgi:hypothetical protein